MSSNRIPAISAVVYELGNNKEMSIKEEIKKERTKGHWPEDLSLLDLYNHKYLSNSTIEKTICYIVSWCTVVSTDRDDYTGLIAQQHGGKQRCISTTSNINALSLCLKFEALCCLNMLSASQAIQMTQNKFQHITSTDRPLGLRKLDETFYFT